MKNTIKLIGLAALTAALIFAMASCKVDPPPPSGGNGPSFDPALNGTWNYYEDSNVSATLELNNGSFSMTSSDNTEVMNGKYSTSGSNITITVTYKSETVEGTSYPFGTLEGSKHTGTYTLSGDTLTITIDDDSIVFTKQ